MGRQVAGGQVEGLMGPGGAESERERDRGDAMSMVESR